MAAQVFFPVPVPLSLPPGSGAAVLSTTPVVPRFRLGAARTALEHSGCSGAPVLWCRGRAAAAALSEGTQSGGSEPAVNGRSRALRLSQSEPGALPLTNERPGVGRCGAVGWRREGRGRGGAAVGAGPPGCVLLR